MKLPFSFFKISGHSMEPFLHSGEAVLVWQWVKPKVGDVVVFKNGSEFWVKRVKEISGNKVKVLGDNKNDSLETGEIKKDQVIGIVMRLHFG